jgi:serine kinase of HPr protein (carbohydrate metabolism regulator)
MTQVTESQIQAYEQKKVNLESQISNQSREKIILEEQLNQQTVVLMQTFNTSDPVELNKIADGYQAEIVKLEEELRALDTVIE